MNRCRAGRRAVVVAAVLAGGCDHRTGISSASGALATDRNAVDFGPVALHAEAVRHVRLADVGMASVQLVTATSSGPDQDEVQGVLPDGGVLQAGDAEAATLEFLPVRTGTASAQVSISALDPEAQSVTVAATGEGVDARATFAPTALDFGKVEMGSTQGVQLVASNGSPLETRVTLVPAGPDASELTMAPDVADVAAGQSQSIVVSWTPRSPHPLDAWLEALPCPFCAEEQISLGGTGIPYELIAVPSPLNFGAVPKDFAIEKDVALENVSNHALVVQAPTLTAGAGTFSLDPKTLAGFPLTLPAGAAVQVGVVYTATSLQPETGNLEVKSTDHGHPTLDVPLSGNVGGALIAVAPSVVDFGVVPIGARPSKELVVQNQGSGGPLTVSRIQLTQAGQLFATDAGAGPWSLGPQQSMTVHVYFEPLDITQETATIDVFSSDPFFPDVQVAVIGSGRTTLPCQLDLVPPQVDFGTVPEGGGAVLVFHAVDVGSDVCVMRKLKIDPLSEPGFSLPGGGVDSFVFGPGEFAQADVAYRPQRPGLVHGAVTFTINDPGNATVDLPLVGNGGGTTPAGDTPCLEASPGWLDFGPIQPGCRTILTLATDLTNACAAPVGVSKIALGTGTTHDFAIAAAPGTPLSVAPGQGFQVTVEYRPQDEGMQGVPLFVTESDVPRPAIVPVLGELLPPGAREDDFVQQSDSREDVLFVVANTGSMRTKMAAILAGLPIFADALQATALDYHVGVTTTGLTPGVDPLWPCAGGVQGAEAGRLFPADGSLPRILDTAIPDLAAALAQSFQVGYCQYYPQGLAAMQLALTPPLSTSAKDPGTPLPADGNLGFLRNDASLAVVVVSDDDDYSGLPETNDLATLAQLSGYGKQRRVSLSALVDVSGCPQDTRIGQRYLDVAKATAGLQEDLCATDLDPAFAALAGQASQLQLVFPLSEQPQPATIAVTVNGAVAASWHYDAAQNAVVFQGGAAPPAGSQIAITYIAQCAP